MNQSTVQKISMLALAPGVTHVDILPNFNQVWFAVTGHNETRELVAALSLDFQTKADLSDAECWTKTNQLSYMLSMEGLIITVTGCAKEKAPLSEGATEEFVQLDSIIANAVAEEIA